MQSESWVVWLVWLLFHVDFRSLQQDSVRTSKRVVPDFNRLEIWGIKLGWHGLTATNALTFAQEVYTALLAVERSLVAHSPWLSSGFSGMFRDTLHILRIGDGIPLDDEANMAIPGTWHWLVEHDGNIVLDLHRLRHFVQKLRKRSLAPWQSASMGNVQRCRILQEMISVPENKSSGCFGFGDVWCFPVLTHIFVGIPLPPAGSAEGFVELGLPHRLHRRWFQMLHDGSLQHADWAGAIRSSATKATNSPKQLKLDMMMATWSTCKVAALFQNVFSFRTCPCPEAHVLAWDRWCFWRTNLGKFFVFFLCLQLEPCVNHHRNHQTKKSSWLFVVGTMVGSACRSKCSQVASSRMNVLKWKAAMLLKSPICHATFARRGYKTRNL